jgi:hypothetical protein
MAHKIQYTEYPINILEEMSNRYWCRETIKNGMTDDQIKGLEYAMDQLAPKFKKILILRYYEKRTYDGCCEEFEFNSRTRASQLIHMAIRQLCSQTNLELILYGYDAVMSKRFSSFCVIAKKSLPVESLGFKACLVGNLSRAKIKTVGDLTNMIESNMEQFAGIRNLGKKSATHIFEVLNQHGLLSKPLEEYVNKYITYLRKMGKGY